MSKAGGGAGCYTLPMRPILWLCQILCCCSAQASQKEKPQVIKTISEDFIGQELVLP